MIRRNDILVFNSIVDKGDDRRVMIATADEFVREGLPNRVAVKELNDWLPLPTYRTLDASSLEVVGRLRPGDTKKSIVDRVLPKEKWEYTLDLYAKNAQPS